MAERAENIGANFSFTSARGRTQKFRSSFPVVGPTSDPVASDKFSPEAVGPRGADYRTVN
jgi:hypothetical protein